MENVVLDPDRKHTESEAELVMYVFGVSRAEAWAILNSRPSTDERERMERLMNAAVMEMERKAREADNG